MKCLSNDGFAGEPAPDWEIHLRDGFGRPEEGPLGGVTGLHDGAAALAAFLSAFPELARYPLIAVRSTIMPPWSTHDDG